MSDTDIKITKTKIKEKILSYAFKFLQNMQQEHSKMRNVKYEKFTRCHILTAPCSVTTTEFCYLDSEQEHLEG